MAQAADMPPKKGSQFSAGSWRTQPVSLLLKMLQVLEVGQDVRPISSPAAPSSSLATSSVPSSSSSASTPGEQGISPETSGTQPKGARGPAPGGDTPQMTQQESACVRTHHAGADQLVRSNRFALWSVCRRCGQRSSYTSLTGRSSWNHLSGSLPKPSWQQTAPLRKSVAKAPPTKDGEQILDFGKHRGRTYLWAYTNQPGYCYWIVSRDHRSDCSAGLRAFAQYLERKGMGLGTEKPVYRRGTPAGRRLTPPLQSTSNQMPIEYLAALLEFLPNTSLSALEAMTDLELDHLIWTLLPSFLPQEETTEEEEEHPDTDGSEQEQMDPDLQDALGVVDDPHAAHRPLLDFLQADEETRRRVVELLSHVGSPSEQEGEDQ